MFKLIVKNFRNFQLKTSKVLCNLFIAALGDVRWFKHIQMCNIKIEWIRRLYILLSIMNSLFVSVLIIYWQTSQFLWISLLKVSLPWSNKITRRAAKCFWGFIFILQSSLKRYIWNRIIILCYYYKMDVNQAKNITKNHFKQIGILKMNLIIEKISFVILLNTIYSNDFIIFKTGIKIIGQKSLYCANIKAMHAVYIKRIEVKMDCQREWVQAQNWNIISRVLHS